MVRPVRRRKLDRRILEELGLTVEEFGDLTDDEQDYLVQCLEEMSETGTSVTASNLLLEDFKWQPVSMEQFLSDPFYMGELTGKMFPLVRAALIDIFDTGNVPMYTMLGGCVDLDAMVQCADGSMPTMRELLGKRPAVIATCDTANGHFATENARHSGVQKVVKLTLANGSTLRLTPDHKVRVARDTAYHWIPAGELRNTDFVMMPRNVRTAPTTEMSLDEAAVLAYWNTKGSCDKYRARYRDESKERIRDVSSCLRRMGIPTKTYTLPEGVYEVHTLQTCKHGLPDFLHRHRADTADLCVEVPRDICTSSDDVVARFLNRVFSAHGTVVETGVMLSMTSRRYLEQIQMLLLRFGITARHHQQVSHHAARNVMQSCWQISVTGGHSLRRFFKFIGVLVGKKDACANLQEAIRVRTPNTNVEVYPVTTKQIAKAIRPYAKALTGEARRTYKVISTYTSWLSIDKYNACCRYYQHIPEVRALLDWFNPDAQYVKVRSVVPEDAAIEVGDIGVPGPTRFLCNGVSVHNSIGWGKSMMSSCILIYLLYRLSCLRDPHTYYELVKGNKIYLAVYSVNLDQALDGIYGKVLNWIDQIPYFNHKCPRVKRVNSVIKFTDCPVEMIVASKPDHTIGKDVFACCLDEGSFFRSTGGMSGDEVADAIYTGTESRLTSRFMQAGGHIPGMIIVASSKTTKQSFYEKKVKDLKPQFATGRARVFAYSQWEVKPASNFVLPRFQVEIGDRVFPSRMLSDGESPRPGADTIWVPGEFLSPFKQDVDKALRDLAGIASEGMLPLFRDKRVITDCCDPTLQHPFTRQSVTLDVASDLNLDAYFKPETLFKVIRSKYELRLNPNSPRFIGMDLALTGDSLGMAMCHISGFKTVKRVRADGTFYDDRAPVIIFDFVLEIKPPMASEIDLSKARAFVLSLRDYGIEIARISLDTSNSRDMVQTFRKLGFDCNLQSVSRTDEQYLAFRQGIMEKRVRYYEYAPLISNLSRVERDMEKRKVIHPKTSEDGHGHGDVSDAATQAYWAALTDKRTLLPEVNYRDMVALSQDTTVTTPGGSVLWNVLDSEATK